MWRLVLVVSLLCCSSEASVSCKDEKNNDVDWYILYKTPRNLKMTGLDYVYIYPDNNNKAKSRRSTKPINAADGILANTLQPLFINPSPTDFGFISYNDGVPEGFSAKVSDPTDTSGGSASSSFGHSKGVVMVEKNKKGVWLLHSTPGFPYSRDQYHFYPESGARNAQTLICVTFNYDQFEHIGEHLQKTRAFPFDHHIPSDFHRELQDVTTKNTQNHNTPANNRFIPTFQQLTSSGGKEFHSIAKLVSDQPEVGDLYVSISNEVHSGVNVQSWGGQPERDGSFCPTGFDDFQFFDDKIKVKMLLRQRGTTRAKLQADHHILDRQRQDAERDKVVQFCRKQQTCDIKNSWLQSSERLFLRGTVDRHIRAAVSQHELSLEDRRDRLRGVLETEEQQLLQEMEEKKETSVERQAKMRQRARALRDRRETERQQLVSEKLDQLFREQCEEVRSVQSRQKEQQVCEERAVQLRSREEQQQQQQQEEQLFHELWEADRRAKEERERQKGQRRQQRDAEQLDALNAQTQAAERQRQEDKQLREEEAQLLLQQQQLDQLQQQREQQQQRRAQQSRRQQLDQGLRLKMKRVCREQQEELQLDISILQQLLKEESDERQEAAQRKLRAEQQRYRQYLSDELQHQRIEEEQMEQLMEEKLKETWSKREEQSRLQRDARNRLMSEVMEARHLQIQHKLDVNVQKQAELSKDRDELIRIMEETKLMDEEEKRRQQQTCAAYRADLQAQMKHQQQLKLEQKAQEQQEQLQGLIQQQLYQQRKERILSRPLCSAPHPFRRDEDSCSAAVDRLSLT
ncbi:deoxyribonuclease-2-beta-like [Scomber scombrus]|uniref:Cilia- and flagella-associated protein 53 n=1 Tax=Scomber scombrus TaxID=13677 RepID=A0AAV1QD80_SCOSC